MSTPNTNTATSSVLDDVQKRIDAAKQKLRDVTESGNKAIADIQNKPDAPGTGYEEILKTLEPEKPKTVLDPKKEKSRAMITNIADAISAMSGIVGAGIGADVVPATPLSAVNQKRYQNLLERRKAEQDAYNRALTQSRSQALSLADYYRRLRQQQDANLIAQEGAKIDQAKREYDLAVDAYNRARQQGLDKTNVDQFNQQQTRLNDQFEKDLQYKQEGRDLEYNAKELAKYVEVPGGKYVSRADYPAYVSDMWNALAGDEAMADRMAPYLQRYAHFTKIKDAQNADKAIMDAVEALANSSEKAQEIAKKYHKQPQLRGASAQPKPVSKAGETEGGAKPSLPGYKKASDLVAPAGSNDGWWSDPRYKPNLISDTIKNNK